MSRPAALFDFDGTLTHGDSLIPFLRMVRGTSQFARDLLVVSPWLLAYAMRVMRNDRAKEALLRKSIGGIPLDELRAHGQHFAEYYVPGMLRADTVDRFCEHRAQGHLCVLVSASLDIYLKPWAESIGFDYCIASSLEVQSNGKATGLLRGGNCFGENKVHRIQSLFDDIGQPTHTYAYGDSEGDTPMLNMVDEGYRVKKGTQSYANLGR